MASFSAILAISGVGIFGIPISILTKFILCLSLMIVANLLVSRIDKFSELNPVS